VYYNNYIMHWQVQGVVDHDSRPDVVEHSDKHVVHTADSTTDKVHTELLL